MGQTHKLKPGKLKIQLWQGYNQYISTIWEFPKIGDPNIVP